MPLRIIANIKVCVGSFELEPATGRPSGFDLILIAYKVTTLTYTFTLQKWFVYNGQGGAA